MLCTLHVHYFLPIITVQLLNILNKTILQFTVCSPRNWTQVGQGAKVNVPLRYIALPPPPPPPPLLVVWLSGTVCTASDGMLDEGLGFWVYYCT